jgi:hypothetical protein
MFPCSPFIDGRGDVGLYQAGCQPCKEQVEAIINRSLSKNRLNLAETAVLLNATDPEMIEMIKQGARRLKEQVYGKRIVFSHRFMLVIIAQTIADTADSKHPIKMLYEKP